MILVLPHTQRQRYRLDPESTAFWMTVSRPNTRLMRSMLSLCLLLCDCRSFAGARSHGRPDLVRNSYEDGCKKLLQAAMRTATDYRTDAQRPSLPAATPILILGIPADRCVFLPRGTSPSRQDSRRSARNVRSLHNATHTRGGHLLLNATEFINTYRNVMKFSMPGLDGPHSFKPGLRAE